MLALQALY